MIKTFEITYRDPHTDELKTVLQYFADDAVLPAKFQAEDYAYSLADKGYYTVKEST